MNEKPQHITAYEFRRDMYVNKIILGECKVWGGGHRQYVVDIPIMNGFLVAKYVDGSLNTVENNSSFDVTWLDAPQAAPPAGNDGDGNQKAPSLTNNGK